MMKVIFVILYLLALLIFTMWAVDCLNDPIRVIQHSIRKEWDVHGCDDGSHVIYCMG